MKTAWICLLCWAWLTSLAAQMPPPHAEEIVIFWQSKADSKFTITALKQLDSFLVRQSLPVRWVDVSKRGAPAEVATTPSIFYQQKAGRYLYKGRYTSMERVYNFARTARVISPSSASYALPQTFVMESGRGRVFLHTKITQANALPSGLTANQFARQATDAIAKQLRRFQRLDTLIVQPSDVDFYFDYYPYFDAMGNLSVSYALYSHYDCITPIFKSTTKPAWAKSTHWAQAFATAAATMEKAMFDQLEHSTLGDAVAFVAAETPVVSWSDLDLELPTIALHREKNTTALSPTAWLSRQWEFEQAIATELPVLSFHFAPPMQNYAGEARTLTGSLQFNDALDLASASGHFSIPSESITMGLRELDSAIYAKILHTSTFPTIALALLPSDKSAQKLEIGKLLQTSLSGELLLLGKKQPVGIGAQLEVVANANGEPRLRVEGVLVLKNVHTIYNIEVPECPEPDKGTMIFHVRFLLKPAKTN